MESINSARLNTPYKIKAVTAEPKIRERLKNIGLFEGAQIMVVKFSRGRKNALVHSGGALIGLRQNLAAQIYLTAV